MVDSTKKIIIIHGSLKETMFESKAKSRHKLWISEEKKKYTYLILHD
jgi:hypothetical protein